MARVVAQKLVRRHPHVFGDVKVSGSAQVLENWEAQKAAEKGRTSAVEGVPLAQPAMALAAKLMYRAEKFGYDLPITHPVKISATTQGELGELLMGIIDQAISLGLDPEAALRGATKGYIARITEYEAKTNGS